MWACAIACFRGIRDACAITEKKFGPLVFPPPSAHSCLQAAAAHTIKNDTVKMGASSSTGNFFPTRVVQCDPAGSKSSGDDARYDYECSSSSSTRAALTTLHLLILVSVLLLGMCCYVLYLRICARRFYNRLRALPLRRLPVGRDVVSRSMHETMVKGFAASMERDRYPPVAPRGGRRAGGTAARRRHAQAVAVRQRIFELAHTLGPLLRTAFATEMHLLGGGLGALAPVLEARYGVPPSAVFLLAEALEASHAAQSAEENDDPSAADDDDRFSEAEYARVEAAAVLLARALGARRRGQAAATATVPPVFNAGDPAQLALNAAAVGAAAAAVVDSEGATAEEQLPPAVMRARRGANRRETARGTSDDGIADSSMNR